MWIDKVQEDPYNRREQQPASVGAGGGSAPAAGTDINSGVPSAPSAPATPVAPQQNFASVQDYFKANKQQGDEFGQKVTQKLGETAQKQKETVLGAAEAAKKEVQSGVPIFDAGILDRAKTAPGDFTKSPELKSQFDDKWNAAYQGPASFEESGAYGKAADAVRQSQEKKEQLKSTGGRQQLIQDEFGVYGQGNRGLDEGLLQTSSQFPVVQAQERQFGGLGEYLKGQSTAITPQVDAARQQAAAVQKQTRDTMNKTVSDFTQSKEQALAQKKAQAAGHYEQAKQALANLRDVEKLSAAQKTELQGVLGLTPSEMSKLLVEQEMVQKGYNAGGVKVAPQTVNLTDYLKYQPQLASLSSVVSSGDMDRARAYAALTGDQNIIPAVTANPQSGPIMSFDKQAAFEKLSPLAAHLRGLGPVAPVAPSTSTAPVTASPGYTLLPEVAGQPRQEVKNTPSNGVGTQPIRVVPSSEPKPQVNPGLPAEKAALGGPNMTYIDPANPPVNSGFAPTPYIGDVPMFSNSADLGKYLTDQVTNPAAPPSADKRVSDAQTYLDRTIARLTQLRGEKSSDAGAARANGETIMSMYPSYLDGTLSSKDFDKFKKATTAMNMQHLLEK